MRIREFSRGVFGVDFENYLPFMYGDGARSGGMHYIAEEDGELAASVLNAPIRLSVGGADLLGYGVGTVAVREESRGRGYMTDMFEECLSEARRNGAAFSVLGGLRQRYEHYGYATAEVSVSFSVTETSLRHTLGTRKSKLSLREAAEEDGATLVRLMETEPVFARREPGDFVTICRHCGRTPLLAEKDGEAVGYVVADRESVWEAVLPGGEYGELLLALRDFFGDEFTVHAPKPNGALCAFLSEHAAWIYRPDDSSVSVLDFPALISAYGAVGTRCERDCSFVLGVLPHPFFEKAGIAEKGKDHGSFEIALRAGKVLARRTDRPADVTLPYLRAVEFVLTRAAEWYPSAPGARAVFPLPFFVPSCDKV